MHAVRGPNALLLPRAARTQTGTPTWAPRTPRGATQELPDQAALQLKSEISLRSAAEAAGRVLGGKSPRPFRGPGVFGRREF
eukprot:255536-Alexandrium_andersonii.AAC.1